MSQKKVKAKKKDQSALICKCGSKFFTKINNQSAQCDSCECIYIAQSQGLRLETKITEELADKTLKEMMAFNNVSELPANKQNVLGNLIRHERLFWRDEKIIFNLRKPIVCEDKKKLQELELSEPTMKDLDGAGIDLLDFAVSLEIGEVDDKKASKFRALCTGLSDEDMGKIGMGDLIPLLSTASTFFIGQ